MPGVAATSPRAGAKSLVLTLLGEFVLPAEGSVWTSTVVEGLSSLGVAERNARQALARLGEDGIVEAVRDGRRARWHLTQRGRRILEAGADRIYGFGSRTDAWDGSWVVVICSVPETDRAKRHRLRSQLEFEGFGFIAPTIAVSPHLDSETAADRILSELGLGEIAVSFVAQSGALTTDEHIVAEAWDLDDLTGAYQALVDEFVDESPSTPVEAFGATIRLVDAWRRFPFIDPELPSRLLPGGWAGARAKAVFETRRADWSEAARGWFVTAETQR